MPANVRESVRWFTYEDRNIPVGAGAIIGIVIVLPDFAPFIFTKQISSPDKVLNILPRVMRLTKI